MTRAAELLVSAITNLRHSGSTHAPIVSVIVHVVVRRREALNLLHESVSRSLLSRCIQAIIKVQWLHAIGPEQQFR